MTGLYRDIWRDLVEHNTGGGGLRRLGGHNLHPAPRLRLALGVGGGAGQEAEVQLRGHPVAEHAGEAGHGEPKMWIRVVTSNNVTMHRSPIVRDREGL